MSGSPDGPESSRQVQVRTREVVRNLSGLDISPYKGSVLARRLRTRTRDRGFSDPEAYLGWLARGGGAAEDEARLLAASLSVKVSGFFRDPAVFRALEEQVYPELCRPDRAVAVWSAGCSRGQEAYSLAISLWRWIRRRRLPSTLSVVGTDVDTEALEQARAGIYSARSVEGVAPGLIEGAFRKLPDSRVAVVEEIRTLVRFEDQDLLEFAGYPADVDLIACRNLLIYLRRDVQEDLILALRGALRPGGHLVLGSSETLLGRPWCRFEHVNPARRIYRKPADDK